MYPGTGRKGQYLGNGVWKENLTIATVMGDMVPTNGWYWVKWKHGGKLEILRFSDVNRDWFACGDDFAYNGEDFDIIEPAKPPAGGCTVCNATGVVPNSTMVVGCSACKGTGVVEPEPKKCTCTDTFRGECHGGVQTVGGTYSNYLHQ